MNNIYIVGDCHLSRAHEHYDVTKYNKKFIIWGTAGAKAFDFNISRLKEQNAMSSGLEKQRSYKHDAIPFSEIKDDGVIAFWIGYVDIRTFLSRYDNADEIVKSFIDDVKNNFPNSKVVIMEPLPQFTEMLLKYEGISPYYTYEQRQYQNSLFLHALRKYSKEAGFDIVVTQEEILDILEVGKLWATMAHSDAPHPADGLKPRYMAKIWNLFAERLISIPYNK